MRDTSAPEFARFLQLVMAGRPYTKPVLTADLRSVAPEYRAALALQQRIRYCRDVLQIAQ